VLGLPRAEDAKGDARVKMQYHTAAEALEAATSELAAKDARIAELEVAKYPGCKLLSLGDACSCKICDLERRLAARDAELAALRQGIDEALNITGYDDNDRIKEVAQAQERKLKYCGELREEAEKWRSAASVLCGAHIGVPQATCPVCELATLRGALEEARQWRRHRTDCHVYVPNGGGCTCDHDERLARIDAALATPPRRTPKGEWQPIETAPRDGTRVLGWCAEWSAPNTIHLGSRGWESAYELGPFMYQPTHWMPLPSTPDATEGK
jgi:hypothetical protein